MEGVLNLNFHIASACNHYIKAKNITIHSDEMDKIHISEHVIFHRAISIVL